MTVTDLEQSVRGSLRQANLLQYVDEEETQFLEFPDGWFAEIVVKDGSVLPKVETILQKFKTDLKRDQGIELDEIVRPVWNLGDIERNGSIVSFPGLEPAIGFTATLRSGDLSRAVVVDVTQGALHLIREKLGATKAPEDASLKEIVAEFLKSELSHGGESYWNPRKDSRLELGAAAFMYLMGHRDPVRRLREAINSVFSRISEDEIWDELKGSRDKRHERIRSFFAALTRAGVAAKDFENVVLYLGQPEQVPGSERDLPNALNRELFSMLLDFEKGELKKYYVEQVERTLKDFPDLKV